MSETPATADVAPSIVPPSPSASSSVRPTFAHASEGELARILDFYQVRWEYEPHVFPILWNLDGAVVESFAPDFYLPDLDLYLELTTLRQPLVRRKNRKLRRLRELYPDVRIKLFYARDFRALMLKYGKLGLADGLSGTSGQVPPPARGLAAGHVAMELEADQPAATVGVPTARQTGAAGAIDSPVVTQPAAAESARPQRAVVAPRRGAEPIATAVASEALTSGAAGTGRRGRRLRRAQAAHAADPSLSASPVPAAN